MKKFFYAALTAGLAFTMTSAIAFDSTPPSLGAVTLSQNSVPETGGTVTVTAQVTSSAYGLDQAPLFTLQQQGYSKNFSCTRPSLMRMSLVSGDEKNGLYRCEADILPPLKPGVYKLVFFPLTDKGGNTTDFINTNFSVAVGVAAPTLTPTPKPTLTSKPPVTQPPSQTSDATTDVLILKSQVSSLQSQLKALEGKIKKICSAKPKPKGC